MCFEHYLRKQSAICSEILARGPKERIIFIIEISVQDCAHARNDPNWVEVSLEAFEEAQQSVNA